MKLYANTWVLNFIFFLIFAISVKAEDQIFFPIDKSEIKILPQQFQYDYFSNNRFRIGDTLFEIDKLNFQELSNNSFRFTWPSSLITDGEISIKDSAGKILWLKKIIPSQIKITKNTEQIDGQKLRSDLASEAFFQIDKETLTRIQTSPFIKFCIQKADTATELYLCSPEFYYKKLSQGQKNTIEIRNNSHAQKRISINGQEVGDHGIIYLQRVQDSIFLNATFTSGANLELKTRMKKVDFKDIYKNNENKTMVVAAGAEPTSDNQLYSKNSTEWIAILDENNSFIYLKGEGGIPLKQDFFFEKGLRSKNLSILFSSPPIKNTYSSNAVFSLKTSDNVILGSYDKDSEVKKINNTLVEWKFLKLEPNKINRRYLSVRTPEGDFIGAWDIYRSKRYDLSLSMGFYPISSSSAFRVALDQRWNFEIEYKNYVEHSLAEPNHSLISSELDYKLTPGLNTLDKFHSIFISYDYQNFNSVYFQSLSTGLNLQLTPPGQFKKYFDLLMMKIKVPLLLLSTDVTSFNYIHYDLFLRKKISDLSWDLGLEYYNVQTPQNFTRINGFLRTNLTF